MIDITTTRTMALQMHPPESFIHFFSGFASSAHFWQAIAWQAGDGVGSTSLRFSVITVIVIYVFLDIEYPRAGLIRIEAADPVLVALRQSMK